MTCPACGGAIESRRTGRPRLTCSDRCRQAAHRVTKPEPAPVPTPALIVAARPAPPTAPAFLRGVRAYGCVTPAARYGIMVGGVFLPDLYETPREVIAAIDAINVRLDGGSTIAPAGRRFGAEDAGRQGL